jgi:hypothetical protein
VLVEKPTMDKNSSINRKNVSVTFRLDGTIIEKLRNEADEKVVSLSLLVNQIIKQHVDWHSMAPKAGYIAVRKELIMNLLCKVTEQEVFLMARQIARTTNKDTLMLLKNRISIESAFEIVESWLKSCDIPYRHQNTLDTKHTFIIQHDMGQRWSVYLGELYRDLFETCNAREYSYEARDNTLFLVIETH